MRKTASFVTSAPVPFGIPAFAPCVFVFPVFGFDFGFCHHTVLSLVMALVFLGKIVETRILGVLQHHNTGRFFFLPRYKQVI